MLTSVASHRGHLAARGSSVPRKRSPIGTNSEAGMIRAGSTGLSLTLVTAPVPDRLSRRALSISLVSIPRTRLPNSTGLLPRGAGPEKQVAARAKLGSPAAPACAAPCES